MAMTKKDKAKVFDVHHGGALGNLPAWLELPLEHAATAGDVKHMRKLLEYGASANAVCSRGGGRLLHLVAKAGHEHAVSVLVSGGADVDALDTEGDTALHLAALNNHPRTVAALLAAGANANLQHSVIGSTALDAAAYKGNLGVVMALLQGGASVHAVNYNGYTALHTAAVGGQVGVIKALVGAGANMNAQDNNGRTPLHIAAQENFPEIVTALCELGAEMDRLDGYGSSPLHIATESLGSPYAAQALLAAGANVDLRQGGDEFSALDLAVLNEHVELIKTLIQRGATVTSADSEGRTALHHATVTIEAVGTINLLVGAGADLDAPDMTGRTPLHRASGLNNVGIARALLGHGASANAPDNNKQLPLHLAARVSKQNSSAEMVEALLEGGADDTAVDKNGLTAAEVLKDASNNALVLDLLAKARRQRVWRRRGFFVMCRAHPDRAKPKLPQPTRPERGGVSGDACGMVTRKRARLARVGGRGDDAARNVDGRETAHQGAAERAILSGGIERVVAGLVGMGKDDLFRNVIEFL